MEPSVSGLSSTRHLSVSARTSDPARPTWTKKGENPSAHQNPDLEVLELIAGRHLQGDCRAFRFWFNSSSAPSEKPADAAHMTKVEKLVVELVNQSGGRLKTNFLDDNFFELSV